MRYTVVRKLKEPIDPGFDEDFVRERKRTELGYTEDKNISQLAAILLTGLDKGGYYDYSVEEAYRIGGDF